jgi:putative ABC transport system permease protein
MNIVKIAWRSIQHRGLGSALSILSMALGVMLVVAVLTIHGVVARSMRNNSSFGYDLIVGARGGSTQLTLNTVYYLSKPVENIPYEYYLAFCDAQQRDRELTGSIAYQTFETHRALAAISQGLATPLVGSPAGALALDVAAESTEAAQLRKIGLHQPGRFHVFVEMAVPVCLGDYFSRFRVVGTTPEFFSQLVLDVDTGETFRFAEGRAFEHNSAEHGFFECVVGATVARDEGLALGEVIRPTHGDPNTGHVHDDGFTVVGILEPTGTPHDRAVFVNMEGFYLMDDHSKPVDEAPLAGANQPTHHPTVNDAADTDLAQLTPTSAPPQSGAHQEHAAPRREPLPIEQREVTAILVRTFQRDPTPSGDDEFDEAPEFISAGVSDSLRRAIADGGLERTLVWSPYRPLAAQKSAQAVSPVAEVTMLLEMIVSPVRWVLLILTIMICIVSAISILVGIYNSMSQRRHEISVMRALGASRTKVMLITLVESILLASAAGILGWVAGHGLNALASPLVERQVGVQLGFFDVAPAEPVLKNAADLLAGVGLPLPDWKGLEYISVSTELLIIPSLLALAVLVGVYPAVSAYRTDVARWLGK